jgi:hypothetical protein
MYCTSYPSYLNIEILAELPDVALASAEVIFRLGQTEGVHHESATSACSGTVLAVFALREILHEKITVSGNQILSIPSKLSGKTGTELFIGYAVMIYIRLRCDVSKIIAEHTALL